MSESVPVRCPACRRERVYTAASYPCACGASVAPRLDRRTAPAVVAHRAWEEEWITLRCPSCGGHTPWPRPELGCACGAVLRIPVADPEREAGAGATGGRTGPAGQQEAGAAEPHAGPAGPHAENPEASAGGTGPQTENPGARTGDTGRPGVAADASPPARAPFRSVAVRTARDAVTAVALYLRWLGHRDVRRADQRPTSGVGLAGRGLLAHVDPGVHPASLRDVECLWLTAMTDSADCGYFSLAGYTAEARARADSLAVPLFVLDPTGTPRPVNAAAERFGTRGA
ncbi:hypothetical protein AB0N31_18375 [Streptomyces sp. NPDC051051]|uniref:hypothetical protein n=1 Tax=Streptomyces sp. NPDC051051 TaxID=3155666 RepID=UPI0034290639